jgi:two-component system chemotaxis sensor kinase CheA
MEEETAVAAECNRIQAIIESIAAAVVLTDPSDLQALAQLHGQFEEIARLAGDNSQPQVVADASLAAAVLVENIIMNETPDSGATLRVVAQTIGALQQIIRDGRPAEQVTFPAELPTQAAGAHAEAPSGTRHPSCLPSNVDEKIFGEFLVRQEAAMDDMEAMILSLERTADEDNLASLRRLIHTLKGEAALMGLEDVERLCHITEDSLGNRAAGEMIDGLLHVKDWLTQVFQACAGKGPMPPSVNEALAREMQSPAPGGPSARPAEKSPETPVAAELPGQGQADRALLEEFVCEAGEHLEAADVHLLALETEPHDKEAINAVFRAFHTIKGIAGCLGMDAIRALAHEAESLLDRARKGEMTLRGAPIDVSFDAIDVIRRMVKALGESLATGQPIPADEAADRPQTVRGSAARTRRFCRRAMGSRASWARSWWSEVRRHRKRSSRPWIARVATSSTRRWANCSCRRGRCRPARSLKRCGHRRARRCRSRRSSRSTPSGWIGCSIRSASW